MTPRFLAVVLASWNSLLAAAGAATIDWRGDLEFFRGELPARHKNLFFSVERPLFERELDALAQQLPQLSEMEIVFRLQEIVIAMGDDHSGVDWPKRLAGSPIAPIGLYWFSDGWRLLTTRKPHERLLGCKIEAIGGVPMSEVEKRVARLISRDNPWVVKSRLPNLLPFAGVLRHCGLARDDSVEISGVDASGKPVEAVLSFQSESLGSAPDRVQFQPSAVPYAMANQRPFLRVRLLPRERIYYVHYNRCEGREVAERLGDMEAAAKLPSLAAAFDQVLVDLNQILAADKADKVVFDVQFNPGGASDFGTRFAERVAQMERFKERGTVFVVIGRRTFSSAIINAMDFKRLMGAIAVGELTSGTPNHYGEVKKLALPSSGLAVTYSSKYFGEPGGKLEPLTPDISTPMSFADYAAGVDPSLEAIKRWSGP